ncbi:transcription-repair coupling factor [Murimonas intestini]|uniref:Transcription-repair-coupling factor n=1 Tax=Murimonas intestini TaxID=1337051 RepID=A0AB73T093_9FIRM|nr:transcription-repair coupling factor [Murimonas intestini]MCR1842319.1 transcription-repair coupling factor [Murimonas intestini]MCR1867758.1 transcription-repair coupling factor [Murimonas intestini]MCR1885930.1 transcription-repair coupling factor [Murimonas intestini]
MKAFTQPISNLGEFEQITRSLSKTKGMVEVTGCIDSSKSHFIYCAGEAYSCKVIVTYSELRAKELYEDYRFFDKKVLLYPSKDLIFYSADIHSNLLVQTRISALKALLEEEEVTIITTMGGCMDHLVPLSDWKKYIFRLDAASSVDVEKMKKQLVEMGYERVGQVEGSGQFAVRGGIIDIYPLTEENPVRIELWGDEVDSIRSFDVESQRSIENLDAITVYPAAEVIVDKQRAEAGILKMEKEVKKLRRQLRDENKTEEAHHLSELLEECREKLEEYGVGAGLDSYVDYFYDKTVSFLDYFTDRDTLVVLDEPNRISQEGDAIEQEFRESMMNRLEKGYVLPGQTGILYSSQEVTGRLNAMRCMGLCTLEAAKGSFRITDRYSIFVKSVNPYNNSFELLVKDLKRFKKEGYQVILLSGSRTRAKRLAEDLREYELNSFYTDDMERVVQPGEILAAYGNARKGYEYPLIKFVVISESDIFGKEKKKKKRKVYEGKKIQSFSELAVGDYVVHENHGLGVYKGIEKIEVDKVTKDYMKIEYAGGSNLYILATQLDVIQKYADSQAKKPKLNKLGSQEWNKTKTRVRSAVRDVARDLVRLYAVRQKSEGFQFSEDTVWQREFEEMFPYEETDDQVLAIESTKKDMESRKIMDRLVCGDVGYGKTEVAIRAAFKAAQDGKQVVFLVPTTILAQQHYNTFVQRMKDFPIRVDLMCRFRTAAEQKKTLQDLKKGLVDILIGTHRVLSKDVEFKDLGLLIVDEEQRFGVTHKERIKKLKENVDVLTLTATPIPRTLHMSLVGIRDMSVLEEAPQERQPIQTYVMEYNEEMVREAISRELARGGQVYYVYNRVNTIVEMTNTVAKLVPEANVAFAHGQMKERELERIMYDFINGEIDVLVSTTIIETGLDISNVNTMIIHDADSLGLSQLYQLRGRVGRSNRTAYAFLMYRRNKMLKEIAEKRLHAIREFTDLGSGFKIAMRDLEIRGAGNLLGEEQHGHMEAVGYDLYCKMLNESVKELKGEAEPEEEYGTSIDLDIDAFISEKYIRSESQKLDIYKRVAGIESEEEYDDMMEELMDRFGEPPKSVQNLLAIANLKAMAHKAYITEISQKGDSIRFTMFERAKADPAKIEHLVEKYKNNNKNQLNFKVDTNPYFEYKKPRKSLKDNDDILQVVRELVEEIALVKSV